MKITLLEKPLENCAMKLCDVWNIKIMKIFHMGILTMWYWSRKNVYGGV